ncbi:hypothetical protein BU15DRAFT_82865 [Melanogaster broomeanus]|nr:hypothetical protein BU15DRAFT_82865 [Melanogaster broomeanus]
MSSELMGALRQDAQNNIYAAQSTYSNIFNLFPGPYHPDYLIQNFQMPSDAVPFSTVEMLDTEVTTKQQRTTHSSPMLAHHLLMIRKHILAPTHARCPSILPAEELPMDFLHPLMLPQEEDNLFSTYLQPPKMLPTEDPNVHQQHQTYSDESFGTSQTEFYDSVMQTY